MLGRHLFALEGQNEIPYGEANQRLALDWAHLNAASPGSPPTPLGCRGEWYYSFGTVDTWNHQGVSIVLPSIDAQGQSFESFCADREAESLTGLPGGAGVLFGLDGPPNGMVHCSGTYSLSFSAEASCHQPLSTARFYLIRDGLADGGNVSWNSTDSEYELWNSTYHISFYDDTPTSRVYYGEAWHGTSGWEKDTDHDGLSDGYTTCQQINYTGWFRLGQIRIPIENNKPVDNFYSEFNLTSFNLSMYGELSIGTNPLDNDTDNDSIIDGEEVCGYYLDSALLPNADIINGSSYYSDNSKFVIDSGESIRMMIPIGQHISGKSIILQIVTLTDRIFNPESNLSIKILLNESIEFDQSIDIIVPENTLINYFPYEIGKKQFTDGLPVKCTHYFVLGTLEAGNYSLELDSKSGLNPVILIETIKILVNETSPSEEDTDFDGVDDFDECNLLLSPFNEDTDWDGLYDCDDDFPAERDTDGDGLSYSREIYFKTDPNNYDSDAYRNAPCYKPGTPP